MPHDNTPVVIRIGIHTGPCVRYGWRICRLKDKYGACITCESGACLWIASLQHQRHLAAMLSCWSIAICVSDALSLHLVAPHYSPCRPTLFAPFLQRLDWHQVAQVLHLWGHHEHILEDGEHMHSGWVLLDFLFHTSVRNLVVPFPADLAMFPSLRRPHPSLLPHF